MVDTLTAVTIRSRWESRWRRPPHPPLTAEERQELLDNPWVTKLASLPALWVVTAMEHSDDLKTIYREATRFEVNRQRQKQERAKRAQMERPATEALRQKAEWRPRTETATLRRLPSLRLCPSCGVRPDPLSGACRC